MIPLRTRGKPFHIENAIVAVVSRDQLPLAGNSILIWEALDELPDFIPSLGILSTTKAEDGVMENIPGVYNIATLNHLDNGDIVSIYPDGIIRTLFRVKSHNNSLFVTERCNSNCLMCSQPPKNRDDIMELFHVNKRLINLIPKDTQEIGITGGEPTLLGDLFPALLISLRDNLPNTDIHVLSNGRSFAWNEIVEKIARVNHERLVFGVPLYSDYYKTHDYVVQARDAFNQTITGLYNLARYNLRIEIRVVLHKLTIPRLVKLSKFITKNLPFVEHIALMGLEYTGYTPYNIDKLWIDPVNYQNELLESVEILNTHGFDVSIYNHQLCVIPEQLWEFNRKSISAWKNDYLEVCESCTEKQNCGGFFTSSLKKHSEFINPIH